MECTSESLGAFLVSRCSSESISPLRIGTASTKVYIERGADWCGQGKDNSFLRVRIVYMSLRYTVYIQGILGREITKYTVIYGAVLWFWPTL